MSQVALEPGAYPPPHKLKPVKGPDGIWRLDRIRHRAYSGVYVRTSGRGYTRKECLADWEANFQRNVHKGTQRSRVSRREQFEPTDKFSKALAYYVTVQERKAANGKITQQSLDKYKAAIYKAKGPRANTGAIKLEEELGRLAIGEVGRPSILADYLDDIAEIAPGVAAHHYVILTAVFNLLTLAGLYDHSPMGPVPKPETGGAGQRALSAAERDQFYDLVVTRQRRCTYFRPMILTLLGTGIRPGEALALRWMDVAGLDDEYATIYVCGTVVKRAGGQCVRQPHRKRGKSYYLTLPRWLTGELRVWKQDTAPTVDDLPVFMSLRGGLVAPGTADSALDQVRRDSPLEWVSFGNFRDTAATHIVGKTGDPRRASAQLGHSEGSSIATRHYIDPEGYIHPAVDNADALESLKPAKVGAKLESALTRGQQIDADLRLLPA